MVNISSGKFVALCLTLILPFIGIITLLGGLLNYSSQIALAQPNIGVRQKSTANSLGAVTVLPHDCEAYPFVVSEEALTGLQPGDTFTRTAGNAIDSFYFAFWNPSIVNSSISYVLKELQNPALSLNDFTNFTYPPDRSLSKGDDVRIAGHSINGEVTEAIQNLKDNNTTIRILVIDYFVGFGFHTYGHVDRFILVKISDFTIFPGSITFTYLGLAQDPEECRQFGLSLSPSQIQSGQPGQTLTYTHILTNEGYYTETAWITSTISPINWPVVLSLISQTLSSKQSVTFTTIITIPIDTPIGITQTTRITVALNISPTISATVVDTVNILAQRRVYVPLILRE